LRVRVQVPEALRRYSGGVAEVAVEGSTVAEALGALFDGHPGLRPRVLDGRGGVFPYLRLFVNRAPATLETALRAGDAVEILAAADGG